MSNFQIAREIAPAQSEKAFPSDDALRTLRSVRRGFPKTSDAGFLRTAENGGAPG